MKSPFFTKSPIGDFFFRGLMFAGFGPVILGIAYQILQLSLKDFSLSGTQVFTAILSTYALAFVHAGASVFNQIEHWPIAKSLLCHFGILYVAYVLCYLVNTWIPFEPLAIAIFTAIFVCGYGLICLIVYLSVHAAAKKLNQSLK